MSSSLTQRVGMARALAARFPDMRPEVLLYREASSVRVVFGEGRGWVHFQRSGVINGLRMALPEVLAAVDEVRR